MGEIEEGVRAMERMDVGWTGLFWRCGCWLGSWILGCCTIPFSYVNSAYDPCYFSQVLESS